MAVLCMLYNGIHKSVVVVSWPTQFCRCCSMAYSSFGAVSCYTKKDDVPWHTQFCGCCIMAYTVL